MPFDRLRANGLRRVAWVNSLASLGLDAGRCFVRGKSFDELRTGLSNHSVSKLIDPNHWIPGRAGWGRRLGIHTAQPPFGL